MHTHTHTHTYTHTHALTHKLANRKSQGYMITEQKRKLYTTIERHRQVNNPNSYLIIWFWVSVEAHHRTYR